jgi:hypothetical protein
MEASLMQDGKVVPPFNIAIPAPSIDLKGFHWTSVDAKLGLEDSTPEPAPRAPPPHELLAQKASTAREVPIAQVEAAAVSSSTTPAPPAIQTHAPTALDGQLQLGQDPLPHQTDLFPLQFFQGPYAGNGFNTIWRPRTFTPEERAQKPPPVGGKTNDNVLKLNFTTEQLTFGPQLGNIPNRGLFAQQDISLAGIPYLQTVQDTTNDISGEGDSPQPGGIHFEPGVWLKVPKSDINPVNADTIVRMASIPHGTTINAQGLAPKFETNSRIGGKERRSGFRC